MRAGMRSTIRAAMFTGTVAAVLSSLVVTVCGALENGRALAPHNGPSQWIYGKSAARRRSITLRHTLVGFLIHHASSCWWAFVQRRVFPVRPQGTPFVAHIGEGAVIAVLASVVDYKVVPQRLQPGFDKHVSLSSLTAVYVAFGIGIALGAHLLSRAEPRRRPE